MRPVTKVLGWGIITVVAACSGCMSLAIAGFIGYTLDEKLSAGQPMEEHILTVERQVGQEQFVDGTTSYLVQAKDVRGNIRTMSVLFATRPGDRLKWRYRRTQWLGLPMAPVAIVKCDGDQPC